MPNTQFRAIGCPSDLFIAPQSILIQELAAPEVDPIHVRQATLVGYSIPIRTGRRYLAIYDPASLSIVQLETGGRRPANLQLGTTVLAVYGHREASFAAGAGLRANIVGGC